jgi:hypothetical protein
MKRLDEMTSNELIAEIERLRKIVNAQKARPDYRQLYLRYRSANHRADGWRRKYYESMDSANGWRRKYYESMDNAK